MGLRGPKSELVLLVDVNFWDDPKIQKLSAHERDQWLHILAEQLRTGNGATLPLGSWGLSKQRVSRYVDAGLLDKVDEELRVHKWDEWNGREAYKRFLGRERIRRLRARRKSEL